MNDLAIKDGFSPSLNFFVVFGVLNFGTLTLNRSTVSGNGSFFGGGISNGGTLTLTDSTVSGNAGGGIANASSIDRCCTLTLTSSTVEVVP